MLVFIQSRGSTTGLDPRHPDAETHSTLRNQGEKPFPLTRHEKELITGIGGGPEGNREETRV